MLNIQFPPNTFPRIGTTDSKTLWIRHWRFPVPIYTGDHYKNRISRKKSTHDLVHLSVFWFYFEATVFWPPFRRICFVLRVEFQNGLPSDYQLRTRRWRKQRAAWLAEHVQPLNSPGPLRLGLALLLRLLQRRARPQRSSWKVLSQLL